MVNLGTFPTLFELSLQIEISEVMNDFHFHFQPE